MVRNLTRDLKTKFSELAYRSYSIRRTGAPAGEDSDGKCADSEERRIPFAAGADYAGLEAHVSSAIPAGV